MAGPFRTMADVKRANLASDAPHWFSRETMMFFGSRVHGGLIAGRYFITSEDNFDRTERLFTVRRANDDGKIDTIGGFQAYATLEAAREAAKKAPC